MAKLTPLHVYKLLPKTNCGECAVSTCMAFAAAVIKQEKEPAACPHVDPAALEQLDGRIERQVNLESIQAEQLKELQQRARAVDLLSRAPRVGARTGTGTIILQCLGKDFAVDRNAKVASHCHTHAWFSIPLLDYVVNSAGEDPTGRWTPFRELPSGRKWSGLFERRCERPLKQIADAHPDLFADLIALFSGSSGNSFASDISVVLHPLPKVPVLICYWKPEDDMESKLHVFFDENAEKNLPIDSLFTLGTGMVMMLEKIMLKHTDGKSLVL